MGYKEIIISIVIAIVLSFLIYLFSGSGDMAVLAFFIMIYFEFIHARTKKY